MTYRNWKEIKKMSAKNNTNTKPAMTEEIVTSASAPLTPLAKREAYSEFAEHGEVVTSADLLLERYSCVQGTTRAKSDNRALREGMFYGNLSKVGIESAVVIPIHEIRHIVEKQNDNTGKFIRTLSLDDPRVTKAYKANGNSYIRLLSVDADPPTKLVETYDVHVVFLAEDGLTPEKFGVLQFFSNNLIPRMRWKSDRQAGGRSGLASYFFRSVVTCEPKKNKDNADSMIFKIDPFQGKWDAAMLNPENPRELELLRQCKAHKDLIVQGKFGVSYADAEVDETAEEEAEFSAEDDGRQTSNSAEAPNF